MPLKPEPYLVEIGPRTMGQLMTPHNCEVKLNGVVLKGVRAIRFEMSVDRMALAPVTIEMLANVKLVGSMKVRQGQIVGKRGRK